MVDYFIEVKKPFEVMPLFLRGYGENYKRCFSEFEKLKIMTSAGYYGAGLFDVFIYRCYNGKYKDKQVFKSATIKGIEV